MKSCEARQHSRTGAAGFTQILVLLSLATISAILTASLAISATNGKYASVLDRHVRGDIAAESAIRRVLAAIDDPADTYETEVLAAENPLPLAIGDLDVRVSIEGEGGKIDPMVSDRALLFGYAADLGMPGEAQAQFTAAIDVARQHGSAADAMEAIYLHLLPFVTSDEIERDFGSFGQAPGIDPVYATERVLKAAPDLSDAQVTQILRTRLADPLAVRGLSRYFSSGASRFSIVAIVRWSDSAATTRRLPIQISGAGRAVPLAGL